MNARALVCERGEAVKKFIGFCGGPATGTGRNEPCLWQSTPQASGEQAERLVIEHYRTEHPRLLDRVSAGAMNGKLVLGRDAMVSRIDLEDGADE